MNFDIQIFIFDNAGNQTNAIILKEAFPISLSDVSLSWSENNKLYEFSVRFAFKEWFYSGYNMGAYDSRVSISPGQTAQVVQTPTESPRNEIGLDPRVNKPTNPYNQQNPNVSPDGMLFGPGGLSG